MGGHECPGCAGSGEVSGVAESWTVDHPSVQPASGVCRLCAGSGQATTWTAREYMRRLRRVYDLDSLAASVAVGWEPTRWRRVEAGTLSPVGIRYVKVKGHEWGWASVRAALEEVSS